MSKDFNEKNIYEAFNDMNFDEKEYEKIPVFMDDLQRKKLKNNIKRKVKACSNIRKFKIGISIAAITIMCITGVIGITPGLAKGIPVLNSVIQKFYNKSGYNGKPNEYVQGIGEITESNDIKITINEAVYDESHLTIAYTIKSNKNLKQLIRESGLMPFLGRNIKINGKRRNTSGGIESEIKDDNTISMVSELDIENEKLPTKINVDIELHEVFNIHGNWKFSFKLSKDDILCKTKTFNPNVKMEFPNSSIIIDEVICSPINTCIKIKGKRMKELNIEKGDVPNNNGSIFDYDNWFIFDNNGKEIAFKGSAGEGKGRIFNTKIDLEAVNNIPKYLTVIPCKYINSKNNRTMYDMRPINCKYPIELNQGKFGKIIVDKVKVEKDKTIIEYRAEGKAPYSQACNFNLQDDKGEFVEALDKESINNVKRDKNNHNKFTLVLDKIDVNKKYFLCANILDCYEIHDEYSFKIPLEK